MLEYSVLYPVNTVSRQVLGLDGMWKFKIDWDSEGRKEQWQGGLSDCDMIPVPASFQDFYTTKEIREFVGDVWYETDVMIPSAYKVKRIGELATALANGLTSRQLMYAMRALPTFNEAISCAVENSRE